MMEYNNGNVAIHPRLNKLITALTTAVEDGNGSLDKAATSYDNAFDTFRLSLQSTFKAVVVPQVTLLTNVRHRGTAKGVRRTNQDDKQVFRNIAEMKTRLEEQFRTQVQLSKDCASRGDSVMAWFHRNTAETIARYLETMK